MKPESRTILPSPDVLNNLDCGRFVLSNLAAKRAKQIKDGAPPLIRTDSNHPLSIALAEIAAGKIKPILTSSEAPQMDGYADSLEELRPSELALLLPGYEDSDIDSMASKMLIDLDSDLDSDLEDDEAEDEVSASLSDLLDSEDEDDDSSSDSDDDEEDSMADSDSDTMSLDDLQEDEESEDSEDDES